MGSGCARPVDNSLPRSRRTIPGGGDLGDCLPLEAGNGRFS